MKNILIYGTFDFFHYGHRRLLKRAKRYGCNLYVGVCTDKFNLLKGKRAENDFITRASIVEKYQGVVKVFPQNSFEQKKDDVIKYNIDYLIAGSDWTGSNDHLKKYCKIIYLPRTPGISSSDIRRLSKGMRNNDLCLEEEVMS